MNNPRHSQEPEPLPPPSAQVALPDKKRSRFEVQNIDNYKEEQPPPNHPQPHTGDRGPSYAGSQGVSRGGGRGGKSRFLVEDAVDGPPASSGVTGEPPSSMACPPDSIPPPAQNKPRQKSRFQVEDADPALMQPPPPAQNAPPAQPAWTRKTPQQWTVADVCDWLESLGKDYAAYKHKFEEAGVDGDLLTALTEEEMIELEVQKKIHRRKILKSIQKLNLG